jgi:hypothetical protein
MVVAIEQDEVEERTPEEVKRFQVQTRLANDYLYYAPRCHKINNKAGQLVPFKLNESQIYVHGLLKKELERKGYIRAIMLKCRQWGGSTFVESWYYHKISYRKGKRAVIMTEADMSRDNLFNMVKTFHENAPKAVRPMTRASNEKALIFDTPKGSAVKGLRSRYDVKTCESKGGLGITTHYIHLSEYAFFKDASLNTVAGLLESVPSEYPAILGTQIIIESTANGVGGIFYNTWKESEQQEAEGKVPEYLRIFIPWFFHSEYKRNPSEAELEEIKGTLSDDEEWLLKQELPSGRMVSYAQLKWRRWKISTLVPPVGFSKEEFFKQWYPATAEEAFIYSGKQVFPASEVRATLEECYSPMLVGDFNMHTGRIEKHPKGLVKIWEKPKPGCKYVIGGDVAEGLANGDFSSLDVLKLPYGQQVAQVHGKVDPDTFGELAYHLGIYYHKALMGIESNNHGLTTITALKKKNYPNLYQREKLDANADGRKTKTAGWLTTKKSKYKIIDQLRGALRDGETGICCKETLSEMGDYTIHEGDNGTMTYGAKLGCFDDRVMSLAIGLEMLYTIPKAMKARSQVHKRNNKDKKPAWATQAEIENITRMQRSNN